MYQAVNRAARQSALAKYDQHWASQLSQVQHSLNKGDPYSAYKCLNQISKQKSKADRALCQHGTGRLLHTAEGCVVEWVRHCTYFLSVSTWVPISPGTLCNIPAKPVTLIKDLHTQLPSKQSWPQNLLQSSLKQGCVLAPNMFNIKLDATVRQLLPKLQHFGVIIAYKLDGQLMHSHKPTHEELMWVLMYAPEIMLVKIQPDS